MLLGLLILHLLVLLCLLGCHGGLRVRIGSPAARGKQVAGIGDTAWSLLCKPLHPLTLQLVQPSHRGLLPRGCGKSCAGRGGSHQPSRARRQPSAAAGLSMHCGPARRYRLLLLGCLCLSRASARRGVARGRGSRSALRGGQRRLHSFTKLQLLLRGRQRCRVGSLQARRASSLNRRQPLGEARKNIAAAPGRCRWRRRRAEGVQAARGGRPWITCRGWCALQRRQLAAIRRARVVRARSGRGQRLQGCRAMGGESAQRSSQRAQKAFASPRVLKHRYRSSITSSAPARGSPPAGRD